MKKIYIKNISSPARYLCPPAIETKYKTNFLRLDKKTNKQKVKITKH